MKCIELPVSQDKLKELAEAWTERGRAIVRGEVPTPQMERRLRVALLENEIERVEGELKQMELQAARDAALLEWARHQRALGGKMGRLKKMYRGLRALVPPGEARRMISERTGIPDSTLRRYLKG